jgi:alkylation response protein AidB-like acyl-CoA dehydrogenase
MSAGTNDVVGQRYFVGDRPIFGDDHAAFRDSVRRFVTADVVPGLSGWRTAGATPRDVVAAAGAAGFFGIGAAEEFGGAAIDDRGFLTILIEETADAGAAGLALLWALHGGVVVPIVGTRATRQNQQRWLPGLISGELIGVPVHLDEASVDGETLTGRSGAVPFGDLADLLIGVLPDGRTVLIPREQPGFHVAPIEGLAAHETGTAVITLDGVRVELLDDCADVRHELLLWFSVIAVAGARYALRLAVEYARERKVFGKPLAVFENTRLRLAHLTADLVTTSTYVDTCLAAGADVEPAAVAIAGVTSADVHDRCVDQALQLHGGYGYMREYPISTAFADARFLRLLTKHYTGVGRTLADDLGL